MPPQWRTVCDDHCTYTSDATLSWNGLHTMNFVRSVTTCWHFKRVFHTNHSSLADKGTFFSLSQFPPHSQRNDQQQQWLTKNSLCGVQNVEMTVQALLTDDILHFEPVNGSWLSLSSSLLKDKFERWLK